VMWKQFSIDFDNTPPKPHPPVKATGMFLRELQSLRADAVRWRIDATDAFEEYAAAGKYKNSGIMPRNRFIATMGVIFRGNVTTEVLDHICAAYGTGDPDPRKEGCYLQVRWKQFAIDFDNTPPLPPPELPDPTPDIIECMKDINTFCNYHAIDLENDIEEYLGGKDVCTSDLMPTGKFIQAMGVLIGSASSPWAFTQEQLNKICKTYGTGRPWVRNSMLKENVQWREFAKDLALVQPMPYLRSMTGKLNAYPQSGHIVDGHILRD